MAKLLDLLVAAEGFVPVAGRVYAQDGNSRVFSYAGSDLEFDDVAAWWGGELVGFDFDPDFLHALADDHTTAVITAEAILEARACQ